VRKLAILFPLLFLLTACVTGATKPQDVIATACAPSDQYLIERCAEAVGDVYMVFQKRALEIVSDPATPEEVKGTLKSLDRELTPAVRTLVQTSAAYVLLREAQSPDASAKQSELAAQLATVQPRVQTLPKL
jgi:outer membrane PBP1 activator LpoA protein